MEYLESSWERKARLNLQTFNLSNATGQSTVLAYTKLIYLMPCFFLTVKAEFSHICIYKLDIWTHYHNYHHYKNSNHHLIKYRHIFGKPNNNLQMFCVSFTISTIFFFHTNRLYIFKILLNKFFIFHGIMCIKHLQ